MRDTTGFVHSVIGEQTGRIVEQGTHDCIDNDTQGG